jgi:serine/threonine-protein kinase
LGAVAYYLLAGQDVFNGKSVVELCIQHLHQAPEPLVSRGVAVPAELEALVLACLDKNPEQRPQTAGELRRRLHACIVPAWDSEQARAWWLRHEAKLAKDELHGDGESRTIEVDGPWRSLGASLAELPSA